MSAETASNQQPDGAAADLRKPSDGAASDVRDSMRPVDGEVLAAERSSFSWTAHPARERPAAAVVACLVIMALAAGVQQTTEHTGWGILAALVLCLSLQRFFFATSYEIDDEGVAASSLMGRRSIAWRAVRRIERGSRGAWISPYRTRRRWEGRRGVHILYGSQRDAVLKILGERIPVDASKEPSVQEFG